MPHKSKKRYQNKEKSAINITRKKKKRLKRKLLGKKGRLVIKNLPYKVTEEVLKEYLKKFGEISDIKLLQKSDGTPRGHGFVQFATEENATDALKNCNGKDFMGRKIVINWVVPRSQDENNVSKSEIKQDFEEVSVKIEPESEEEEESSSQVKTERKPSIINTELVKNSTTKESKKSKNAKKGRLIIRNLPFKVNEKVIRKHFEKYGEINEVTLLRKDDGKLVGCGFIQFARKNSAAKAILKCSGKPLLGRTIILDWAVPKSTFLSANETSDKDITEITEVEDDDEDNDGTPKKQSASHIDDSDIELVNIKEEADDSEEEEEEEKYHIKSDTDESSQSESSSENDDENIKQELDDESKQKIVNKKPKVISNDISEGRTVFVKNVPFSATNEDLKVCMEQFGDVIYALICMDQITEHSKGTAFVKFKTKESADQCLSAGTELVLHDQTLDVYRALNKDELQNKMNNKNENTKDNRNLYLVKEGVILAGSKAAVGVSTSDMAKRLQLEQWKTQMLRNLNMFVSRVRLVIHNLPPSWDGDKLRQLFLKHAGSKAVIKEARVMRDLKNVDAQGVGKSKEYGFVTFRDHDTALTAVRNINNNPNIFTANKRPIVAFSIENKAIMNIKQKRLEKSKMKNPVYSGGNTSKHQIKKSKSSTRELSQQKFIANQNSEEEVETFTGVTAKPGKIKMRNRFGFKTQAKIHKQSVREAKHERKRKQRMEQQKKNIKEKIGEAKPKKGVKRKPDDEDDAKFSSLVNNYKKKLLAVPLKKWYDE